MLKFQQKALGSRVDTYCYKNLYHYDIYFTIIIFIRLEFETFDMSLHQMQLKTSVYLKAFSTLIFNAGQILQKKKPPVDL